MDDGMEDGMEDEWRMKQGIIERNRGRMEGGMEVERRIGYIRGEGTLCFL